MQAATGAPGFAAEVQTLADAMRPKLEFVDVNRDGKISIEELRTQLPKAGADVKGDPQLAEYYMGQFDLNGDRTLNTDEFLSAAALDVSVDEAGFDDKLWRMLDKNHNNTVDLSEWLAGVSSLGTSDADEAIQKYVFEKANNIHDGTGVLSDSGVADALLRLKRATGFTDTTKAELEDAQFMGY